MVALILGSAACLDADLEAFFALPVRAFIVVACNDAGWRWPGTLHHWFTLHPERFSEWEPRRAALGHPPGYVRWTVHANESAGGPVDRTMACETPGMRGDGTSGLSAAWLGWKLVGRGVLCGVPLDRRPHMPGATALGPFETADAAADEARLARARAVWERDTPLFRGRLRSMSGWTRELLGSPTEEWLWA